MAITVGLATYPLVRAGGLMRVAAPLALIGLLLVAVAVAWPTRLTGPLLVVLVAEYLAAELTGRVPTVSVIAYAVGLAVLAEVLDFNARVPAAGTVDVSLITRRLLFLGIVALGAAVIAVLVLVVGRARGLDTLAAVFVGATAALLLCVIPWVLIQRAKSRSQKG